MRIARTAPILLFALLACGCGESFVPIAPAVGTAPDASVQNTLQMRIDGIEWRADHEVFGAFHPPGYERALIVAGARGAKDANEQQFNINLFGIDGPGRYPIRNGDAAGSVAQLANYTPERFIAGSMMGYDLLVDVRVASAAPAHIEAGFSGTLPGNDGVVMKIEDGRFVYRE